MCPFFEVHPYVCGIFVAVVVATHAGTLQDGGYYLCEDAEVGGSEPIAREKKDQMVVYSFGIENNMDFDAAAAGLGYHVFSFDHTIERKTGKVGTRLEFIQEGYDLAERELPSARWVRPLAKHVERLHHHKIQMLKLDIEGAEWDFLTEVLTNRPLLDNIHQIALEMHFWPTDSPATLRKNIRLFNDFLSTTNFHLFWTRINPNSYMKLTDLPDNGGRIPCCFEMSFINVGLLGKEAGGK